MPYSDHERRKAVQREAQRRRRARVDGVEPRRQPRLPALDELRYATAQQVLALLSGQAEAVLGDPALGTVERARTLGYLSGVLLRAVEVGAVEDRLAVLEQAMEGGALDASN